MAPARLTESCTKRAPRRLGENVAQHDAQIPCPQRPGRFHIGALFDAEHLVSGDPEETGDVSQGDAPDHNGHTGRPDGGKEQGQKDAGQGLQAGAQAHEQFIPPAAKKTGGQPQGHSRSRPQADRGHPHRQGNARAPEDAAEHIPSEVIRPQGMLPTGGLKTLGNADLIGIMGGINPT